MNKLGRVNNLVSVIIPAYNEMDVIGRLLDSLKSQCYRNIEIIVVDDASTDNTSEISKRYTKKVYVRSHAERSVQRNFGASKAKGNYLLFLDADMELTPEVIEKCVVKIKTNGLLGAIEIPEISVTRTFWEKVKGYERSFYNESGDRATDAARFFTKEAFEKAGGYDEGITGPEDWDLPENVKKIGFEIGRVDEKILHYERVPNPIELARKKFRYGLKSYRYFEKHKISLVGQKTIYLLRPVFYKNWRKLAGHPILTLAMFVMLTLEQIGGGLGFLIGKVKKT